MERMYLTPDNVQAAGDMISAVVALGACAFGFAWMIVELVLGE